MRVARNSLWEAVFGGVGAKTPAAGGTGVWGKASSHWRHEGLGVLPQALENFAFFC